MQQLTCWPSPGLGLHASYVQGAAETCEKVNATARSLSIHSDLRIPFYRRLPPSCCFTHTLLVNVLQPLGLAMASAHCTKRP
jgi:hypothetical protein